VNWIRGCTKKVTKQINGYVFTMLSRMRALFEEICHHHRYYSVSFTYTYAYVHPAFKRELSAALSHSLVTFWFPFLIYARAD